VRVFHCDDSSPYRRLIELVAADWPDIEIVGGAGTRAESVTGVAATQPDVVLLDAISPDFGGELVDELLSAAPRAKVVVLSGQVDPQPQSDRVAAVVGKGVSFLELEAALRRVHPRP
jgi:DNA-binding NarL/FixJ family response regulator